MAAFEAIFGSGSAATPLFQETSAFRRKDHQYASRAPSDWQATKHAAPPPAPAAAAKPSRKRKAPQDVATDGKAKITQQVKERPDKQSKLRAADAAATARRRPETQQRVKKQKPDANGATAPPKRAAPASVRSHAQPRKRPTQAASGGGSEGLGPAVDEGTHSAELGQHLDDAPPAEAAPLARPVRKNLTVTARGRRVRAGTLSFLSS